MMITALLEELGFTVTRPETLLCDNNSAVLTYASEFPEWRTPTLGTKYWHSRDYVDGGDITIRHVPGEENNSDIHTKWLPNPDHLRHTQWMGMFDPSTELVDDGTAAPITSFFVGPTKVRVYKVTRACCVCQRRYKSQ